MSFKVAELFADMELRDRGFASALSTTRTDLQKAEGGLSRFSKKAGLIVGAAAVGGLAALAAGFGKVAAGAIGTNATLETAELQFETLLGSADRAEAHVASLFDFAKRTPFETQPIIDASRMLQTFGGDALNTEANLLLIGDAAAGTASGIDELGFWTGRLRANLDAGKPFGEAAARLTELAVLSPQARSRMEELAAAGADGSEIWQAFEEDLGRFSGSMEKQASSWEGLTSTFKDQLSLLAAEGLRPVFEGAKLALESITGFLDRDDVQAWVVEFGERLREMAKTAVEVAKRIAEWLQSFRSDNAETLESARNTWNSIREVVAKAAELLRIIWDAIGEDVIRIIGAALRSVQTIFQTVLGVISGILDVFIGLFTGDWSRMGDGLRRIWDALWSGVRGLLTSWLATVGIDLRGWITKAKGWWDDFKQGVIDRINGMIAVVKTILDQIVNAIQNPGEVLKDIGRRIVQGLIDGIQAKFAAVREKLQQLTNLLPDWKGPESVDLRILAPSGEMVMQGLIAGIESRRHQLRSLLSDITGDVRRMMPPIDVGSGPASGRGSGGLRGTPVVIQLDSRVLWEGVMPHAVDDVLVGTGRVLG